VDLNVDNVPPLQITDLKVTEITTEAVSLQFSSPGDDLDSEDLVERYILKFSSTSGNLSDVNFDSSDFNTEIGNNDLTNSDLSPVLGGTLKKVHIKSDIFKADRKYTIAVKSMDEAGNTSPVSNKVEIYRKLTPDHCLPGWIAAPGGCYSFILYKQFNWIEAQHACHGVGGFLAEPKSQEAAQFLSDYAQMELATFGLKSWWIGLSDQDHENQWMWEESGERVSYSNWATGYPTEDNQNCAVMDVDVDAEFRWSTSDCENSTADVICQM